MKRKKSAGKKKTIVICSSASFYKQVIEVRDVLKKMGFKVLVPLTAGKMEKSGDFKVETYKTWFKDSNAYDRKKFLTKHHFNKVAEGDAVLVLNYEKNGKPGYIGGAVLMEMGVGLHLGKKVYILHPIDESVSYKEEIYGMLPVILNGDLGRIR
jgi:diphthamide synthase subunit DPH2